MAVRVITAPPGHGKTLNMTKIAIDLYRKENSFFKRIKEGYIHTVNIYSNYPILLWYQKKPFKVSRNEGIIEDSIPLKWEYDSRVKSYMYIPCDKQEADVFGVFSNKIDFIDMRIAWVFNDNSSFFIDELQYIYDSQEYKDFPDCIAHFFQVHRHLGYNFIYTNSQSLSRVIKRVLCVSEEFWNVYELKKYLLLPFLSKTSIKVTYDVSSSKNDENSLKEDINADYLTFRFFNKRVFRGYSTRYLCMLNENLPRYPNVGFNSLLVQRNDIIRSFNVSSIQKEELKNIEF